MSINFNSKIRGTRYYAYNRETNSDKPITNPEKAKLSNFESDRGRIINSAAIRRLQQKTQVFPLERNAAVRSRLTHSLEVQQVGRFIVQLIIAQLQKQSKLASVGLEGLERQLESIVEMSCLMHDIGNPPFGHFGEQAINDWFTRNLRQLLSTNNTTIAENFPAELIADLNNFEGNAQAIRLIHSLLELNLTYSQVSGIMKYTRRGDENKPSSGEPFDYLKKKVGYYVSEAPYIEELRTVLNIAPGCRSPFSYIMEAADDISYGLADIEDAVEKGILTTKQLIFALKEEYQKVIQEFAIDGANDLMSEIIKKAEEKAARSNICGDSQFFITLRVEINQKLPQLARDQFINNIEAIYHGHYNQALIENKSPEHALVKTLKNVAIKYVFCDDEVEARELQGYRIISGLLECYKPLLQLDRNTFSKLGDKTSKTPLYETRLYSKLSNKHLRAYEKALEPDNLSRLPYSFDENIWEFYFRVRLIQDYISGMTDQYALDEYRALHIIDEY